MSEGTVRQLATTVGIPVEQLLSKLQQAGISVTDADSTITDEQKQILLSHLKHFKAEDSDQKSPPAKLTLKKKTSTKIKATRKTVTVTVRKKRTFEQPVALTLE